MYPVALIYSPSRRQRAIAVHLRPVMILDSPSGLFDVNAPVTDWRIIAEGQNLHAALVATGLFDILVSMVVLPGGHWKPGKTLRELGIYCHSQWLHIKCQ